MWCESDYVLPSYVDLYFGVKGDSLMNFVDIFLLFLGSSIEFFCGVEWIVELC